MKLKLPEYKPLIAPLVILALLTAFFGWFLYSNVNIKSGQIKFEKIVARVGGVALIEADYTRHERILNGPERYKQSIKESAIIASRSKVIADLVVVTKLENEAKKKGIYPGLDEVDEAIQGKAIEVGGIDKLLREVEEKYGWSKDDLIRSAQIEVVKEKLQ